MSSVDFMLLALYDWNDEVYFKPCGATDAFADFPKISGVISAIRNFESYKASNRPIARADFIKDSAFVEAYKSAAWEERVL